MGGMALTRVVPHFLAQFGIAATRELRETWQIKDKEFPDDLPGGAAFAPGMLSFAGSGAHSRTTEMFFVMPETPAQQLAAFGQEPWETPFAVLADVSSLAVLSVIRSYGDMPPWDSGPAPQRIRTEGYEYLAREFPELDYFSVCHRVGGFTPGPEL